MINYLKERLRLIRICITNSWQKDTAYFSDNWGNVLSTVMFTITFVVFMRLLYNRIPSIGGFSYNDMLLLALAGQLAFYWQATIPFQNMQSLAQDVNTGAFDIFLVRPVPHRFFARIRNLNILKVLRDGLPNIILLCILIDWPALSLTWQSVVAGVVVFIVGLSADTAFVMTLALPSLWTGSQSRDIANLFWSSRERTNIPIEGLPVWTRPGAFFVIPAFISASVAVSAFLNRIPLLPAIIGSIMAACFFGLLHAVLWRAGLAQYASASS